MDKAFSITGIIKGDFDLLVIFYQSLIDNPPTYLTVTEEADYIALLSDYIKKCKIAVGDKDGAKIIVQDRIDNPDSELDQLCATMDLNNIELLEVIEDTSKQQDNVEDKMKRITGIMKKNSECWTRYNSLIGFNTEDYENTPLPTKVTLNNYPNPFNPETTIKYYLPEQSDVKLSVYNIRGQKVKQLANDHFDSGYHTIRWDGTDKNNKSVSSGIYFYRIETERSNITQKMMLLK